VFSKGAEILPGWRVRFVARSGSATENDRIRRGDGTLAFLKVFDRERLVPEAVEPNGRIREMASLESLGEAGVPRVRETGILGSESRRYLLMELVPGETLEARLKRDSTVQPQNARAMTVALLEVVARLHGRDDPIFHNRLSPAHVVLDVPEDSLGRLAVVGFGGARRAGDSAPLDLGSGDLRYLPNEIVAGSSASPTLDVFSVGAIWFHMLFGLPPWEDPVAPTTPEKLVGRRNEPPPIPARPTEEEAIPAHDLKWIRKALAANPADRFADAGEFLNAVASSQEPKPRHRPSPKKDWAGLNRIAGMESLKATLVADVVKPLRDPERYRKFGVGLPNGFLLYGPPGCGKTFVAECLGQELGFAFQKIDPSDVGSPYVHGSQLKIAELFKRARKEAPCVLFLDEVDALIPRREALHANQSSEVNEWLAQLNGAADDRVFVIAATNRPGQLDPSALRTGRLDKSFYVSPPDRKTRESMFAMHLRGRPLDGEVEASRLADKTDGWMASDIRFLVDEAARAALAEEAPGISEAHLLATISRNPPSVKPEEIARYEAMRAKFERSGTGSRQIGFGKREAPK